MGLVKIFTRTTKKINKKTAYVLYLCGFGGELGIRTLGTLTSTHDFQSCPFDQLGQLSIYYNYLIFHHN